MRREVKNEGKVGEWKGGGEKRGKKPQKCRKATGVRESYLVTVSVQ